MAAESTTRSKEIAATIGVFAIIIILVVAISLSSKGSSRMTASTTSTSSSSNSTTTASNVMYKDGNYNAKGTYQSPGGQESITISVTLKQNVVTDTSAQSGATDDEAMAYQSQFISGYKQKVVGKPISSLKLTNVSGSSLTSQGFNDAIKQIETQARA